ncbi:hypothetical protein Ahy_A03g011809 [Arachis hypogaea]|uniref:SWIM-type domain-containing protein n=1 Tax=Arachis hypogaea TaxID=3818 RepID=A0A445DRS5_ARAHY|nr:hypothetical protein Ahy_A03g011809 [Arachis hypogaea]
MDDRVRLKVYYDGHILLQTSEGVKFVCDNPLDIVIPFTLSFEELKGIICEKMDFEISRRVSCILYRYPISVFGGFVQFQTKYVTDEASMQEMFSVYLESRSRVTFIEMYIEFEQSAADREIELEEYNSDSEEDFESNYEVVDPGGNEDEADEAMVADVADVANALANQQPFVEPSFMRSLDLDAMHAPEYPQYLNAELPLMPDGEFTVGMEFSSREAVIKAMKDYTIRRGVDYRVHESEPTTFYAKCTQYGAGCDWLIRDTRGQFANTRRVTSSYVSENEVFKVRECPSGVEYTVDLRQLRCDCGEFQVDRLPCRHVFACCANQRLDWQLYVHDVYKMDQIRRVYRVRFRPLGNPSTWPVYHGPRFVGNPFLRRVSKGRPRMTWFLNEMDTRMLRGPRRCKQCGAEGHSRSRCRHRAGPSNPGATTQ